MSDQDPDLKRSRRQRKQINTDRLPPNNNEAEQAVLGAVLLDYVVCLGKCADTFKSAEVFYDLRHQNIYSTMVEMLSERVVIDVVTLSDRLRNKNLLEEVGGVSYLVSLPDKVASSWAIDEYIKIVHDKYLLRSMVRTCTESVARIYDSDGNVPELIDQVERDILRVRQSSIKSERLSSQELVKRAVASIEDMHTRQGIYTGLSSGFTELDKMTLGFQAGEMIVIAARPSMGKTSLVMNFAEHITIDQKVPVGVFSLEMTADSLMMRMLCSRARVNMRNVREGFLAERDYPKITGAAGKLSGAPLYIDDASGISIMQLRAKARRMWQEHGVKLFIIDYLQLLNGGTEKRYSDSRQQEVADISSGIKTMAKEMNVPVIVLSQLNRELERDKNRRPRLSDLRESGAVEQDADFVGILYRPSKDEDSEETPYNEDVMAVNLLICKQRNGPQGEVKLTFLKSYTRFESAAKVSTNDYRDNRYQSQGPDDQQGSMI